MSDFVDVHWFAKSQPMFGIVLVKNEHYGFKCFIGTGEGKSEDLDINSIMVNGVKLTQSEAEAFWKGRMVSEWAKDNLADHRSFSGYEYDGRWYDK